MAEWMQLEYFHTALLHQMDLVERRLVKGETIPHAEKVFSWFEPHTEWIVKGKLFPPVDDDTAWRKEGDMKMSAPREANTS